MAADDCLCFTEVRKRRTQLKQQQDWQLQWQASAFQKAQTALREELRKQKNQVSFAYGTLLEVSAAERWNGLKADLAVRATVGVARACRSFRVVSRVRNGPRTNGMVSSV